MHFLFIIDDPSLSYILFCRQWQDVPNRFLIPIQSKVCYLDASREAMAIKVMFPDTDLSVVVGEYGTELLNDLNKSINPCAVAVNLSTVCMYNMLKEINMV